jgi:hypothetical protein
MLNFLQSAGGMEKTGITPTLILPHQGGGEGLVFERDAPCGSAGRHQGVRLNPRRYLILGKYTKRQTKK